MADVLGGRLKKRNHRITNPVFIIIVTLLVLIGAAFVAYMWNISIRATEDNAKKLAWAAEASFQKSVIVSLKADISDIEREEYKEIKSSLMRLVKIENEVRFAYIYAERNEKIYFLADSEPTDSIDYSPPGQEFWEADEVILQPFKSGQTVVTEPVTDRWGTWVSVLVPMRSMETGDVVAVFGMDYSAGSWNDYAAERSLMSGIVGFCLIAIIIALYVMLIQNKELRGEKKKLIDMDLRLKELLESQRNKAVLLDNLPGMAYRCVCDRDWTMQFLSVGCFTLTGYKPENLINNKDISFNQIIAPEYRETLWGEWTRVLALREQFKFEYEIITSAGQRKWVLETGQGVFYENERVEALEGIIIDINESKQRLLQIQYMKDFDFMTGLNNRKYFEEEKVRLDKDEYLPLSVIIGDINGVRLINDTFGHAEGDRMIAEISKIIQCCCREGDVLARIGGDEFGILLPKTTLDEVNEILRMMKNALEEYHLFKADESRCINMSTGYGIREDMGQSIQEVCREAEEFMNKHKLLEHESYHSAIISTIMGTMYARSQETEQHAERLATLSKMIGQKLDLPQKSIDELELFAMLHDIGKVGIDDHILNNPGKLNDEEWVIMKKHPEIGYRIMMSTEELKYIADYILSHHERWDGKGYPRGLKGEDIPLLSRILAVADTYDAMTEDRVYRKALSREQAIEGNPE